MPPAEPLLASYTHPHAEPPTAIEYPESDGKPVAETPIHYHAINDAMAPLEDRYRERADVFVAGNMMMYYEPGEPRKFVSPDVFVALEVRPDPRRPIWKTWEEGKLADFVLEVTSRSTRRRDEGFKKRLYQRLGVREYWQYDPTGDYLDPILKGRRLGERGAYQGVRLKKDAEGVLYGVSEVLGLRICLDGTRLRYWDSETGEYLLTPADKDQLFAQKDRLIKEQAHALQEQARALQAARAETEELKRRLAGR